MASNIIIQLAFIGLCVLEAYHDAAVISIQDYRLEHYKQASKLWHTYSAAYVTIVAGLLSWLAGAYWLFPCLLLIRLAVFNPYLNVIRGKSFFYLSDKGLDGLFVKLFSKYAGVVVWSGAVALLLTINLICL